jgi:hypothetical protein
MAIPRVALAAAAAALATAPGAVAAQVVYRAAGIDVYQTGAYVNVFDGSYTVGTSPRCPGAGCGYDFVVVWVGRQNYQLWAPAADRRTGPSPVPPDAPGVVPGLTLGALVGASTAFSDLAFVGQSYYYGLRFLAEPTGALHYGWLRLASAGASTNTYRVLDYAFESTPGRAIAAGDAGGATVIPEPRAALLVAPGLLALGAAARRGGRRR